MRTYTIGSLSKTQLKRLREDITLNSLYLSDYENRYGIDRNDVFNFFDSYLNYLEELMQEDRPELTETEVDNMFFDLLPEYDNINNLLEYQYCFA